MTKDDKSFFRQLIDNLDQRLSTEIRHNGVMIERVQDTVLSIAENVSSLGNRMERVEIDIAEIKENIFDLPEIRSTIKSHSRRLAKLEA